MIATDESDAKEIMRYCTFLDVLGYKNIVTSKNRTTSEKIRVLTNIYDTLLAAVGSQIKFINAVRDPKDQIYTKAITDCVYIETTDIRMSLFTLHVIYNISFGYHNNFTPEEKYTPLVRSGTVYDWVVKFMDISSFANHSPDSFNGNLELMNPVGLGVAMAYVTSETYGIAGMRALIAADAISQANLITYSAVPFECYKLDCPNYLHHTETTWGTTVPLFLLPVTGWDKENECEVHMFELCWPVFKYSWSHNSSDIHVMIAEFFKMESNFDAKSMKHYKATAELLLKALLITSIEVKDDYDLESVNKVAHRLRVISGVSW